MCCFGPRSQTWAPPFFSWVRAPPNPLALFIHLPHQPVPLSPPHPFNISPFLLLLVPALIMTKPTVAWC